jgi:cyclopropane-fatty-acyl-phospholipid synthase
MTITQRSLTAVRPQRLSWFASMGLKLLDRLLTHLHTGSLTLILPHGTSITNSGSTKGPDATLIVHRWRALTQIALKGEVGFAEACVDDDISSPDLTAFLQLAVLNEDAFDEPLAGLAPARVLNWLRHYFNANTKSGSRRNISAHYDLGNAFYEQWLDPSLTYSSAYYTHDEQTLAQAQDQKLRRIAHLLDLKPAMNVLEIGCGWGALAHHLAHEHKAHITGLTLSKEQLRIAQARTADDALNVDLRLQDYRDVRGQFDRIVSIEMIEAVGERYWPIYFNTLRARLSEHGKAVIQAITIDEKRFDDYRTRPDFIQRYIFPGGMLPTISGIKEQAEQAGLTLTSVELFGASYARTLREWRHNFHRAWPTLSTQGFDERFRRMWDYYLSYCEAGFRLGTINVGLYVLEA